MVDEEEGKETSIEAEQITRELCSVFKTHFENMIKTEDKLFEIVHEIVVKTLVCKANRDNPNYPKEEIKEGEIYLYKKGQIFRVVKTYDEPTILMEWVGHNDTAIDTVKTWNDLKMEKLFP